MAKSKGIRLTVTLQCTSCPQNSERRPNSSGIFRYTSSKNRRNTPSRLELKKHCPKCNSHTAFREIK